MKALGPAARLSLAVALVAALGGCSKAPESGGKARSSEAELMLASFLEAHGQDLDSCLKGLPELVGAGGDPSFAGRQPLAQRADRVMLALDASGSMAGRVGGETKMEAAKRAASAFLKGIPDGVAVGLVAFGHRGDNSETGKAESCRGVETIYRIGAADPAGLSRALGSFEARGWTPLADALTAASRSFAPSDKVGAQVVYVVSDGEETCGGDPVAAARALHGGPVKAVVNIIGFDLAPADRAQLREVAEAGGGQLLEARSPSELQRLMEETRHQIVNLHAITGERLQSGHRQTRNNLAVGHAVTRANFCASKAMTAENRALPPFLKSRKPEGELGGAVSARLAQRHDAYRARLTGFSEAAARSRAAANAAIEAHEQAAEQDFERAVAK